MEPQPHAPIDSYYRCMDPVIHDTVTLRHFAAVGRLDILQDCMAISQSPDGLKESALKSKPRLLRLLISVDARVVMPALETVADP